MSAARRASSVHGDQGASARTAVHTIKQIGYVVGPDGSDPSVFFDYSGQPGPKDVSVGGKQ